jgi:predicted exporter
VSQPLALKYKVIISIGAIAVPLVFLLVQNNIWSSDVSQVSPVPLKVSKIDDKLRKELHAVDINNVFLLEGDTVNQVLLKTKKLKSLLMPLIKKGLIGGMQDATDILPDDLSQQHYQSLLPGNKILEKNVSAAMSGMGMKNGTFDNFINAVESSKTLSTVTYKDIYHSPLGLKLESMLFKSDDRWYSFIRLAGVNDEDAFKSWVKATPDISPYYISMHDSMSVLMNNYLQVAWERLLAVLSLIVLVVLWLARKRREAIWLIIPVIAGVLISMAVQVISGNTINIFHVLSLLLVVGMGFDYSLFFNTDWDNSEQLQERTHAIIISALTTIIAFGTLAFSDIPVLSAMGQTVSVGIFTCFIVAQRVSVPKAKEVKHC